MGHFKVLFCRNSRSGNFNPNKVVTHYSFVFSITFPFISCSGTWFLWLGLSPGGLCLEEPPQGLLEHEGGDGGGGEGDDCGHGQGGVGVDRPAKPGHK